MKILITENKLNQIIIDFINDRYDVNNIHWTYGIDDWGNEVDYAASYYEGDYEDDVNLFRWYSEDYFYSEEMSHQNKKMIDEWVEKSPMLEFDDTDTYDIFNGYFGDRWHQPFKDWFMEHFKKPIKTIE
jgi:hypothetical protein